MYKCTMYGISIYTKRKYYFFKRKEYMYCIEHCTDVSIAPIVYIQFNGKVDLNHVHDLPCII